MTKRVGEERFEIELLDRVCVEAGDELAAHLVSRVFVFLIHRDGDAFPGESAGEAQTGESTADDVQMFHGASTLRVATIR